MKKALDGYIDISSLTRVQKECLVAIAEADGYVLGFNNPTHKTLAFYSDIEGHPYCAQTFSRKVEDYADQSRPIISIEDFLSHFSPEWATGVCTREQLDRYWWVDDRNTYQDITREDKLNFADDWQYLKERQLFSFGESSEASTVNTDVINTDKLVSGIITPDHYLPRHTPNLESYKDFCKEFGGSISVNDEYYTYYTDGDDYYEFTSLAEFEEFLRDYEGFFDKYSGNLKR